MGPHLRFEYGGRIIAIRRRVGSDKLVSRWPSAVKELKTFVKIV